MRSMRLVPPARNFVVRVGCHLGTPRRLDVSARGNTEGVHCPASPTLSGFRDRLCDAATMFV